MHEPDRAQLLASAMLVFSRARSAALPGELYKDTAWNLLLELFVADSKGIRLTGRDISHRLSVPPALMSRVLLYSSTAGLVVGDGSGDLDDALTLSAEAMEILEGLMTQAREMQEALVDGPPGSIATD